MKVGVLKETAPGDHRVALVPETVGRLQGAGLDVLVQSGAGDGAWFADSTYAEAGAAIVSRDELLAEADVVVGISRPEDRVTGALRAGQALVGHASSCGEWDQGSTGTTVHGHRHCAGTCGTMVLPSPADGLGPAAQPASHTGTVSSCPDATA